MIGYLKGKIKRSDIDTLILDVNGVGYEILTSSGFFDNEDAELFIHTLVRENEITLFGFKEILELKLFRLLLGVSGIGGRTALNMISRNGVNGIVNGINQKDANRIKSPGVGLKTAQKVILDLSNKVAEFDGYINDTFPEGDKRIGRISIEIKSDLMGAAQSLGYQLIDFENSLFKLEEELKQEDISKYSVQELLKKLLKYL